MIPSPCGCGRYVRPASRPGQGHLSHISSVVAPGQRRRTHIRTSELQPCHSPGSHRGRSTKLVPSAAAVPPRQSPMPPPPVKGPLRRYAPLTGSPGTSRPPLWDSDHPLHVRQPPTRVVLLVQVKTRCLRRRARPRVPASPPRPRHRVTTRSEAILQREGRSRHGSQPATRRQPV